MMYNFYDEEGQLRSFSDFKTEDDLLNAILKHRGKRDSLIEQIFNLWQESLQWNWFNEHQSWQLACEHIDEYNSALEPTVDDETGETIEPVLKEKPDEPIRPTMIEWSVWKSVNYQILREAAYPSIKEQLGMQYHDQLIGTSTWLDIQNEIKTRYPKP